MKAKKFLSLVLSVLLLLTAMPKPALADTEAQVYLTVSMKGVIASDNGGKPMANRGVTVKDIDGDGTLTYDEALIAAHKAYNQESGYATADSYGYTSVTKLWGTDTYNTLFFVNNTGISGVSSQTVEDGDKLVASINKDDLYYADWYTFFDVPEKNVKVNEEFSLTLSGHLGMAYMPEDLQDTALSGISIGLWNDGSFAKIDGKVTDESGKVSLSFDKADTYYVTADGTVDDEVTVDWSTYATDIKPCPIIAPVCIVTVTEEETEPDAMSDDDAVESVYNKFSAYSKMASGLVFPLEYNDKTYTNVISYIKDWAKEETGRDVTVNYGTYIYTTSYTEWSSGSPVAMSYDGLDEDGNITQGYFTNNDNKKMNYLKDLTFTVGEKTSDKVDKLYLSIKSFERTPEEIVAYVKENLPFARIANGNEDEDHIIQKLGEGTSAALPNTTGLYSTNSVTVDWSCNNVSGKADAMSVNKSRQVTIIRPNVGEENAVFDLEAKITSKSDTSVIDTKTFRLTVPAFDAVYVPVKVTEGASLSLIDSYYGASSEVDSKYIVKKAEAQDGYDIYECILHTNSTGGIQKFKYTATKDGYITKSGTISVADGNIEETVIDLTASSEDDTKLSELKSIAPEIDIDIQSDKTEYSIDVDGVQSIKLAAVTKMPEASAKITSYYSSLANANKGTLTTTGKAVSSSGVVCYLPDAVSTSVIKITVTAPEGSIQTDKTRTYTVTVNKKTASLPMTALTVTASSSSKGTKNNISAGERVPAEEVITPTFVAGGNQSPYTYTVNYWRDQIAVKPTAKDCTITVNGISVNSGSETEKIPLSVGDNIVTVSVTKNSVTENYTLNIRRKAEFYISNVTLDEGELVTELKGDGSDWTGSCNFDYNAESVHIVYHTNLSEEEEKNVIIDVVIGDETYSSKAGQAIEIPVGDANSVMPTVWAYYKAADDVTEGQRYIISLKRKAADGPSAVESYLPAPGQFVNLSAYQEALKTLNGSSIVTLGAFGGNIVYKYDEPIKNSPNNSYGIDFIVYGNCFTNSDGSTSSGAAEPASVMVSKDGVSWYELAGSEYYSASARHNLTVTYTNGDTTFAEASDTSWVDSDGEKGVLPANEYHKQAYYPNPEYYNAFQKGVGKNSTYNENTVSFTGTMIESGFYPFGYADSHSENSTLGNSSVNPYTASHAYDYNGDGFDISWAVDKDGNPVYLDEISYIKIYNSVLSYSDMTGEKSPEIKTVLRASANTNAVGKSSGLASLDVNGSSVEISENVYTYAADGNNSSVLKITPVTENPDANIYVSNKRVKSGETASVTAVDKVRIIVQEGNSEPVIYIINLTNVTEMDSNADLTSVTINPGDVINTPENNAISFNVENAIAAVRFTPETANKNAKITLSGGSLNEEILLGSGEQSKAISVNVGTNEFVLKVSSVNGENENTYKLIVTREAGNSGSSYEENTINVKFSLTGDRLHYDKSKKEYTGTHAATSWISQRAVTVPKGATVKYLTEMMLNNAEIDYVTNGVYISEINGIGEFDNGPDSGWLYRKNGEIANVGYGDCVLSDGDVIKWFYTDDYTKETGYEGGWDAVNSRSKATTNEKTEDANNDNENKEEDIAANQDVIPVNAKASEVYKDVSADSWYENAVSFVTEKNLFKGVSETEFAPDAEMTRAMLVTVLFRLENPDNSETAYSFADVDKSEWYADAVAWAAKFGVVSGISETEFAPNDNITREQMAVIIYRYAKLKGYDTQINSNLSGFSDNGEISDYAIDALKWANGEEIIMGVSDTSISPKSTATRAQVAAILMRFCENIISM